jgi:hypothetical protein
LYPKEESLASHIKKHLTVMAPEKMQKYEKATKWNILWRKIEEKVIRSMYMFYFLFICMHTNKFSKLFRLDHIAAHIEEVYLEQYVVILGHA